MACVVLYGYALGGYAGYSFGQGRPDYVVWGLSGGTLCGAAAMRLWKKWMKETTPDILIFDVDGVLIDTRESFRLVTAETVRWCWENLLEGDADCEGYTPEHFHLCKSHPAFNDDAIVAWALLRRMKRDRARTGSKSMKETFPTLEAWGKELSTYKRGEIAGEILRETETLPLTEVRAVMEEIYYGQELYEKYKGKSAHNIEGGGFWNYEKPAISTDWKALGLPVGIYTGRTRKEMSLAQKHLNWLDFPQEMLISADDGISKPSPLGLSILCERSGTRSPLFFGDTASDKEAWLAFRKGVFVAIGPILKTEALRDGNLHFDTLEEALSLLLEK
jgi:phosphoglycolate phosphatase-like HAD superfamily hydrolase